MIRLLRFEDSEDGSLVVTNAHNQKTLGAVRATGDGEWLALIPRQDSMEAVAVGSRSFALTVIVSRLVLVRDIPAASRGDADYEEPPARRVVVWREPTT
jgi:hypothetical protein